MCNTVFLILCISSLSFYVSHAAADTPKVFAEKITIAVTDWNQGILRLRNMVHKSNGYNRWMRVSCESRKLACTKDNYRELLLTRLELLMPSDVVARAAFHSRWGTSREAMMGNNHFGIQCQKPLCGFRMPSEDKIIRLSGFDNITQALDALSDDLYSKYTIGELSVTGFDILKTAPSGKVILSHISTKQRYDVIERHDLYQYDKAMFADLSIDSKYPAENIARFADYLPSGLYAAIFDENKAS